MDEDICRKGYESEERRKKCEPTSQFELDEWMKPNVTHGTMWIKLRDFIGKPRPRDFKTKIYPIPQLQAGEILVEALCWSVVNHTRIFEVSLGSTMTAEQVACVIASRHKNYPVSMLVVCSTGWQTHSILQPDETPVRVIHSIGNFPASVCLGNLGLPGLTAYFGLLKICQPKPGNIVLVNAAGGPVGSVVGQIAKIIGCTVIAFARSRENCDWMRELGFDYVYRESVTVDAALSKQAPGGIDCCFDCVGEEFMKQVVRHMKPYGTIVMCGFNSCYGRRVGMETRNDAYRLVHMREGRLAVNSICDFGSQFAEAHAKLLEWMNQGKLRYNETRRVGFELLPSTLADLDADSSVGNIIVKSENVPTLTTSCIKLS